MYKDFEERKIDLIAQIKNAKGRVSLGKETSNLFRDRKQDVSTKLDVRHFNHILGINVEEGYVDVEGMTPYDELVAETIKVNVMPTVVPELKSITIGGAITGGGIESSSFKYGFVHETAMELEILTADGQIVLATPTNEHKNLFYGFPNSYGTLGYVLRVRMKVIPIKKYVKLAYTTFTDSKLFFAAMAKECAKGRKGSFDFIDGVVFSSKEMCMSIGKFVDEAPYTSDYTYKHIYYKSMQHKKEDYLSTHDYIWRWDTDWFWCSRNFGAQNKLFRCTLFGKKKLNSRYYNKVKKDFPFFSAIKAIVFLIKGNQETVIQDVEIPIQHAPDFLHFFNKKIGIKPVWICPSQQWVPAKFDLFVTKPEVLYMNFGFWDFVPSNKPEGYHDKLVEKKVQSLGGVKSLYSTSYFDEKTFWQLYNKKSYDALKKKYDSNKKLLNLYQKCVLKQ